MEVALLITMGLIVIFSIGMVALVGALGVMLYVEYRERSKEAAKLLASQQTIPPPPVPPDHARVMARPRLPTVAELKAHQAGSRKKPSISDTATPVTTRQEWRRPSYVPAPAAITPHVDEDRVQSQRTAPMRKGTAQTDEIFGGLTLPEDITPPGAGRREEDSEDAPTQQDQPYVVDDKNTGWQEPVAAPKTTAHAFRGLFSRGNRKN
jgi:hypothetical protein